MEIYAWPTAIEIHCSSTKWQYQIPKRIAHNEKLESNKKGQHQFDAFRKKQILPNERINTLFS